MSVLKTYLDAGLSLVPLWQNTKKPCVSTWEPWKVESITQQEVKKHFRAICNVGIIGGMVSGGLVAIDVDVKYDLTGKLWESFSDAIKELSEEFYNHLIIQKTPSGGYHIVYRCPDQLIPSGKLAERPATQEELDEINASIEEQFRIKDPNKKPYTLIEVKAEGGYIVAEPSTIDGGKYEVIQGSFSNIPVLTIEQSDAIMNIARFFNEIKRTEVEVKQRQALEIDPNSLRPGDDFNQQHSVWELLQRYGWSQGRTINNNCFEISRPGKKAREKSGIVAVQQNICYIHTTSSILPTEQTLNAFAVYAYYEHGGDFSAAGKDLYARGFGTRRERSERNTQVQTTTKPKPQPEAQGEQANDPTPSELEPFALLGYRKEDGIQKFCFYVRSSKIVVEFTASQLSKGNLMTLAPLQWWETNYPGQRGGIYLEMAQNAIIQQSNEIGFFDAARVRGRGAWRDDKDTIIHVGNSLIKNGKPYRLGELQTKYIYEAAASLGLQTTNPLPKASANRLMEILNLIAWERGVDAELLAGWCVIAPICGVLSWRPHLWLTGGKGTGKSWIFLNIVRRLLGETALPVQGKSSEAGIRQMLKYDAVPVVFDEIEATDADANQRIQNVLSLMRAASADDGGIHALGTSGGTAQTYRIRSCFAFASISVALDKQSDRSRVTVIGLSKKGTQEERRARFEQITKLYHEIVTDDWVKRLQARTISLIPVIVENARVFAAAAAAEIGEQRLGDQVGALLAGAYTLYSDSVVTYEKALEFVRKRDWSAEKGLQGTEDETALLSYILDHITEVEADKRSVKRNVGELVAIAAGYQYDDEEVTQKQAIKRLNRLGLRVDEKDGQEWIVISDSALYLKTILKPTAWANNHNKILLRLESAQPVTSIRFGSEMTTRAVRIPLDLLTKE